jgi:hypothetical protein
MRRTHTGRGRGCVAIAIFAVLAASLVGVIGAPTVGAATTYQLLTGDFTGDGFDDFLFYAPGTTADRLWDYEGTDTPVVRTVNINGTYKPIVGDFTGDGVDDVFWHAPGSALDHRWDFNPSSTVSYTGSTYSVVGTSYRPVAGDLSADGADDIVWYAPGTAGDSIWDFNAGGGYTNRPISVYGTYQPLVGQFSHDAPEDIFWYAPGAARESMWTFDDGSFSYWPSSDAIYQVVGTYLTGVVPFGEGDDDIVFASPGPGSDFFWDFSWDASGEYLESIPMPEGGGDGTFTEVEGLDIWGEGTGDLVFYDGNAKTGQFVDFWLDSDTDMMTWDVWNLSSAP